MKIGIIGTTGEGKITTSGQEIRTRILIDALVDYYGADNIYLVDTGLVKRSKARALISLLKCFVSCRDIILIVSRNGLHTFLPVLSIAQKLFGKRVYNNIIGGNILELISENPQYPKYMKAFTINWVQMESLAVGLRERDVSNVEVLPNSKPLKIVDRNVLTSNSEKPFRFCTFSRVSKAKGTEIAIRAIEQINAEVGETIAELTIYGKPDDDYAQEFQELMKNVTDAIHYGGVIAFDKAPEVLSNYFMLLFPTTFYGEGFPGTIIDAYASGIPVIASDWKFNPELIEVGKTGYLYNHESYEEFLDVLREAISNPDKVNLMRYNCIEEAKKYTPDNVMPIIFNKIDALRGE